MAQGERGCTGSVGMLFVNEEAVERIRKGMITEYRYDQAAAQLAKALTSGME